MSLEDWEERKLDLNKCRKGICPFCGHAQTEGDVEDFQDDTVYVSKNCPECGHVWNQIYTLTRAYDFVMKQKEEVS